MATSSTVRSTATSQTCACESNPIRPTRATSSRCWASAIKWSTRREQPCPRDPQSPHRRRLERGGVPRRHRRPDARAADHDSRRTGAGRDLAARDLVGRAATLSSEPARLRVVTVNAGSTSLKLERYDLFSPLPPLAAPPSPAIGLQTSALEEGLAAVLRSEADVVAHRFVRLPDG